MANSKEIKLTITIPDFMTTDELREYISENFDEYCIERIAEEDNDSNPDGYDFHSEIYIDDEE